MCSAHSSLLVYKRSKISHISHTHRLAPHKQLLAATNALRPFNSLSARRTPFAMAVAVSSSCSRTVLLLVAVAVCCCNCLTTPSTDPNEALDKLEKLYVCATMEHKTGLPAEIELLANTELVISPENIAKPHQKGNVTIPMLTKTKDIQQFTINISSYDPKELETFAGNQGWPVPTEDRKPSCKAFFKDHMEMSACEYVNEHPTKCVANGTKCGSVILDVKCHNATQSIENGWHFFTTTVWKDAAYDTQPCKWKAIFKDIRVLALKQQNEKGEKVTKCIASTPEPEPSEASPSATFVACVGSWLFVLLFALLGILLIALIALIVVALVSWRRSRQSKEESRKSGALSEEKEWIAPVEKSYISAAPPQTMEKPARAVDEVSEQDDDAYNANSNIKDVSSAQKSRTHGVEVPDSGEGSAPQPGQTYMELENEAVAGGGSGDEASAAVESGNAGSSADSGGGNGGNQTEAAHDDGKGGEYEHVHHEMGSH